VVLAGVSGQGNAVVSMDGYVADQPDRLKEAIGARKVVAYYPADKDGKKTIALSAVAEWLADGLLSAAVIEEGTTEKRTTTYTAASMPPTQ
jgi:hypothetical protein